MRGDDAVNDAQHLDHNLGPTGEQEAQGKWEAQDPLAHGLFGRNFIDQQRCTLGHVPRPAARVKTSTFTAECDKVLGMEGLTLNPQKTMF
jgi:hypothetical protein